MCSKGLRDKTKIIFKKTKKNKNKIKYINMLKIE